jgi:hypothetical protein
MRPLALTAASAILVAAPLALAAPHTTPVSFRLVELKSQGGYGEPSLAISKTGRIAVCIPGGNDATDIWYSKDDGHTFGTSHTTNPAGGGDCEIDFLPNGTLLDADLEIKDSAIHYSTDSGKTWKGGTTAGIEQDRQWFAHSKDGKKAYLVYHDFVAEGEFYAESDDGGLTWPTQLAAQPVNNADQVALPGMGAGQPGQPASLIDQGGNTFSGPMLLSPDNRDMYVLYSISDAKSNLTGATPPYGPTRGIVVAHKGPESTSFTNDYAVPSDGTTTNGAIFPWGSVDAAGNVYVFYNSDKGAPGHFHTYYVFSTDHAKHWSKPVKVDGAPLKSGAQIYSTGQAGAAGVLDLAWYGSSNASSPNDKLAKWQVHFAQVRGATTAHPSITRALVTSGFNHVGDICLNGLLCELGGDRSLLDFFELAIGTDGMAQIAYADNHTVSATDGRKGHVIWAKQLGGRSAYAR